MTGRYTIPHPGPMDTRAIARDFAVRSLLKHQKRCQTGATNCPNGVLKYTGTRHRSLPFKRPELLEWVLIWEQILAQPRGTIRNIERAIGAPRGTLHNWRKIPPKYADTLPELLEKMGIGGKEI